MNECICCRDRLIRHLSHRRMYWFCPSCHQEMPNIDEIQAHRLQTINHKRLKYNLDRQLINSI